MKKLCKKILPLMLVLCLLVGLTGCGSSGGDKQVVNIFSANYEDQIALQLEYLKGLYPDAEINITYMSSGKLAAKIQAEGVNTEADIVLSLSSGYANTLKAAGLLKKYDTGLSYKSEFTDADGVIIPNGVWCGAFVVNTEELARLGLPEPKSYQDLLDPVYKNLIVMANPSSSATGYFFLLGVINEYGEEAAFEYFDKLSENILLFGESGSTPTNMVEMGEAVIGLGMDYDAMRLVNSGKPVKVIFPEEGSPYDFDTVLLIDKGEEPSEFVMDIMAAITSAEGNRVFNNYNITVLEGGEDRGTFPEDFKFLNMDGIMDAQQKSDLLAKWSARYE